MKISQFIKSEIINRAKANLDLLKTMEKVASVKTKQQKELDAFFFVRKGSYWDEMAQLVEIIVGYQPSRHGTINCKNFQIVVRPDAGSGFINQPWIILKTNMYGSDAVVGHGYYTLNSSDQLAPLKVAEDFITKLKNMDVDALYNTLIQQLGPDMVNTFNV